jgi:hypothetical protein
MIDPTDVTKYDRTIAELEDWWLFSTIVAGKTAATQARLLDRFLIANARHVAMHLETGCNLKPSDLSPFDVVRYLNQLGVLGEKMREGRLGQYTRLERCWIESLSLDLQNGSVADFEAIHGVGPKTARMFLMHSRPDQRFAAIDTHVLKYLNANGVAAPKATPPAGKLYRILEDAFLKLADDSGMTVADFDLMVWKSYAR